jgi:sulfoxide reductase heme-binding subunit YedZ
MTGKALKTTTFVLCLVPFAWTASLIMTSGLGANPAEKIIHLSGDWALNFILITLSLTPLHRLSGWTWPVRLRRMAGLFAFFYAVLHFIAYAGLDQSFSWGDIMEDALKHKRIIVGFVSFVLLLPPVFTSTDRMVRRLGYRLWNRLHRLVYAAATGGAIHYLLLVKKDIRVPLIYAAVLAVLLGYRMAAYLFARRSLSS